MDVEGFVYGDGSGYHQDDVGARTATWSIVRMPTDNGENMTPSVVMRGAVGGWWPTVPRGELWSLIKFLQHCSGQAAFVGDCRYVVDGEARGVAPRLRSSASLDADLWRIVHQLLRDHGTIPNIVKKQTRTDHELEPSRILKMGSSTGVATPRLTLRRSRWPSS